MNAPSNAQLVDALLRAEPIPLSPLDPVSGAPDDPRLARAFAVHRNTVRHGLIGALRETFPAVRVAVGEDYFDALAAEFVASHPPRSPVLQEYGGDFASFVAGFPPLQDWPWLTDLARIDWARREAYHAADAEPTTLSQWLAQDPATLLAVRVELHPSLRLLASPHPLASLWFAHRPDDADATTVDVVWNPEACRIWRDGERVRVERIDADEHAVLRALSEGRSLLLALWKGYDGAIEQERVVQLLQRFIDDRLIVAIHEPAIHEPVIHDSAIHEPMIHEPMIHPLSPE
jgi:hypothetical protein